MNGKKSTAGNSVLSVFTGNTGIIGVLVILCVVVALATDKFLTPSNIISVLRQISINTYIALGMTLIIILGHIDLAVGAIVAMSGTLTVGFVVNQGLPIGVAIAAGIIIGVVAGLIDGMVVSKFRVPAFIITMAMMNVCNGIAYVYSGGQSTRITDKFFIAIGTGYLFNIIPLPVVYMVILTVKLPRSSLLPIVQSLLCLFFLYQMGIQIYFLLIDCGVAAYIFLSCVKCIFCNLKRNLACNCGELAV